MKVSSDSSDVSETEIKRKPQDPLEGQKFNRVASFTLYGGQALWFPVLALMAFGILFVFSASSVYASQKFGDEFLFVKKQFVYILPGFFAAIAGMKIPLAKIENWIGRIFICAVIATALTKVPHIGKRVLGAARWIAIGPLQIQPSEFLKIATILFASHLLARTQKNLLQLWPIFFTFAVLLAQPDFGTSVVIAIGLAALILIHGIPKRVFLTGGLVLLPLVVAVMIAEPYRVKRLVAFLDPFADPLGSGFQVIQSFVAIANGGWFGKGLGGSQQKLFFLPEAHTDFILAVIGEEMGFAGIVIIALIYGLLFYGILHIIKNAANHRDRLIATGIFSMLAANTIINMGVVAGLLPTKGLPLPFISAGGSALVANLFVVGLLAQINKNGMLNAAKKEFDVNKLHATQIKRHTQK